MATPKKDEIDEASPWNTPLSGAEKPKTPAEIDAAVAKKPPAGHSASYLAGEPDPKDYPNPVAYNLARRKWTMKQTGVPEAGYKSPSAKSPSAK